MNSPDLRQLKRLAIFATVVDEGSFAKAADTLGIARSAVSEQVSQLEAAISLRLLQRTTRKLALTDAGSTIYPLAAQMLSTLRQVDEYADRSQLSGTIRITATADLVELWLNAQLELFSHQYPEVAFDLVTSDHHLDLITEQIDIAICIGNRMDDSEVVRPLMSEQLRMVVSHSLYTQLQNAPLTLLEQQPWVLMSQLNPTQSITLHGNGQTKELHPKKCHQVNSPQVLKSMLSKGFGVGLYLPSMIEQELKSGTLKILHGQWYGPSLDYLLAYPSRQQLPQRVRKLIDFLMIRGRISVADQGALGGAAHP